MAGKTRLVLHALNALLPTAPLWFPTGDGDIERLLRDDQSPARNSVVFLDDMDRFLSNQSLTLNLVEQWRSAGCTVVATMTSSQYERFRDQAEAKLPGWDALNRFTRLRLRPLLSDGELEAAAAADPSASGVTHYLRAASSSPSQEVKERVFTRILEDASLSNDHLDALLEGFAVDSHRELTAPFTARYLGALDEMWRDRPQEVATSVVLGLFPACGGQEDLEAVNAWLASHEPAPAALRRLVLGRRDELARSLQARRTRSDLA